MWVAITLAASSGQKGKVTGDSEEKQLFPTPEGAMSGGTKAGAERGGGEKPLRGGEFYEWRTQASG